MSFIVREDRVKTEYFAGAKLGGFFHLNNLFYVIVEENIAHRVDGYFFPACVFALETISSQNQQQFSLIFPVFFHPIGSHFPLPSACLL